MPHANRPGDYIVFYQNKAMIEKYGPGWEKTLSAVQQAGSNKEIHAIWERTLTLAALNYLEKRKLIPNECQNGIKVIGSGMHRGGGGSTVFRCK
jgi:hypothetical protein